MFKDFCLRLGEMEATSTEFSTFNKMIIQQQKCSQNSNSDYYPHRIKTFYSGYPQLLFFVAQFQTIKNKVKFSFPSVSHMKNTQAELKNFL